MLRTCAPMDLDQRTWAAQADAWQAEGRLRATRGGGAIDLPGARLMASGLPHAQWNSGDVDDPTRIDLGAVRQWYASRAWGRGVPWGLRVPAGVTFPHGRPLFRKRCMALVPADFRTPVRPPALTIVRAGPAHLDVVTRIDADAFGFPAEEVRPWIAPRLDAPGFEVALAALDGEPLGVGTAVRTRDRAGPCVGIFAVAVVASARRRGVAGTLTAWLLARAFDDGAALAHLNPDSEAAATLYARLGFIETAGREVFVDL